MRTNANDPLQAAKLALQALMQAQQAAQFPYGGQPPSVVPQRPAAQVSAARAASAYEGPGRVAPAMLQFAPATGVGRMARGAGTVVGTLVGGKAGAALGFAGWLFTGSSLLGLGLFAAGAAAGAGIGYLVARGFTRAANV